MNHKMLMIDADKCIGCHICQMACSLAHKEEINPSRSVIQIIEFLRDAQFIPITCTQCDEAWCIRACPAHAISINPETNAREVDPNKCVGCKMCVMSCPFGVISIDHGTSKAHKCDLCGGDPQCARLCPTEAIIVGDMETYTLAKMKNTSEMLRESMSPRR